MNSPTLGLLLLIPLCTTNTMADESMHEKTPAGEIVVLELPSRIAMEATSRSPYFQTNGTLFRKLFRYIDRNEIAMTTPVEAELQPGKMRFFVGSKDQNKEISPTKEVKIVRMEPKTVVAIGIRGNYTEERFQANETKLRKWLGKNPKYVPAGDAYAVYWNGPFVPGMMKRSEIHIPVQARE